MSFLRNLSFILCTLKRWRGSWREFADLMSFVILLIAQQADVTMDGYEIYSLAGGENFHLFCSDLRVRSLICLLI